MSTKNSERRKKYRRFFYTLGITFIGCIVLLFSLHALEKIASGVNPARIFFKDFDFSDAYYNMDNEELPLAKAKDIIIINTKGGDKSRVANLIHVLNQSNHKPKVIGLDFYLNDDSSSPQKATDSIQHAILSADNLTIGYRYTDLTPRDTVNNKFLPGTNILRGRNRIGHIALADEEMTIRLMPMIESNWNTGFDSFGLQTAVAYYGPDRPIIKDVYHRQLQELRVEYIPKTAFTLISEEDYLARPDSLLTKDKCVLLGNADASDDMHFTPMNPQLAGRSLPDMAGILIHANLIYTLGASNYKQAFTELDEPESLLIASFLCIVMLCLLIPAYTKLHIFFHFGCVLLYEPAVYFIQLYISIGLYYARIHLNFEMPYLLVTIAPFSIYIVHFFENQINKVLNGITKGRTQSYSYFQQNHDH